jgi:hypothetical protein
MTEVCPFPVSHAALASAAALMLWYVDSSGRAELEGYRRILGQLHLERLISNVLAGWSNDQAMSARTVPGHNRIPRGSEELPCSILGRAAPLPSSGRDVPAIGAVIVHAAGIQNHQPTITQPNRTCHPAPTDRSAVCAASGLAATMTSVAMTAWFMRILAALLALIAHNTI